MAPSLQRAHIITVTTGKQRFACLHAHVLHPEIQGCTSKSTFEIQRRKSCLCTKARAMFCILPEPRLLAGMQRAILRADRRRASSFSTVFLERQEGSHRHRRYRPVHCFHNVRVALLMEVAQHCLAVSGHILNFGPLTKGKCSPLTFVCPNAGP